MAEDQHFEQERLLEEGQRTHIEDEKSILVSILRCSLCCARFKELTETERDALWHLRRQVVNSPKPEEIEIQKQALFIWNAAFPDKKANKFETGDQWKLLGFQGRDPATDVRTGAWPLEQLLELAKQYPEELQRMVTNANAGPSEYLFAITCFNVSHMLVMFFDLNAAPSVSPLSNVPRATKQQLRNLARLIVRECEANNTPISAQVCRRVLNELFHEVMSFVHKAWMDMVAAGKGSMTLMDFPKALRKGFDVNSAFWENPCDNLDSLKLR